MTPLQPPSPNPLSRLSGQFHYCWLANKYKAYSSVSQRVTDCMPDKPFNLDKYMKVKKPGKSFVNILDMAGMENKNPPTWRWQPTQTFSLTGRLKPHLQVYTVYVFNISLQESFCKTVSASSYTTLNALRNFVIDYFDCFNNELAFPLDN
jgi:hypothetical protein